VATRFPFGLFEKSLEINLEGSLLVYPAVDPVTLPPDEVGGVIGGDRVIARGHGDEIMGLRPMRDGDDPRDIYWRRSTQPDQCVMRIRAEETRSEITLFINNQKGDDEALTPWLDQFERGIREQASLGVAYLRRDSTVRVCTSGNESIRATPQQGADGLLTFLALLQPRDMAATVANDPAASTVTFAGRRPQDANPILSTEHNVSPQVWL
jgi:uncharacterized protein (DUF58 family)